MSPSANQHRLWIVAGTLALILTGTSRSQAGIVLSGGTIHKNGDPIYEYICTASLTGGTTFQLGDSFTIDGLVGVGVYNGLPPNHFEPSDFGTLPVYNFTFKQDATNQPLPPPFPQDVTYPTSNVTWMNVTGPTVPSGTVLGQFGVETGELPELYPTISSITVPYSATVDGGKEHDTGTVTFYLATPEPSSLAVSGLGAIGFAGLWLSRLTRLRRGKLRST